MSKRVLVIDDSPFVFKAVSKALEGTDWEVIGNALDGQMGVDKYIAERPDIITLDVTMPIMDGLETARKLFEINPKVRIVMLSAMGDETLLNQAKEIGIRYFLTKPFQPAALQERLAQAFE